MCGVPAVGAAVRQQIQVDDSEHTHSNGAEIDKNAAGERRPERQKQILLFVPVSRAQVNTLSGGKCAKTAGEVAATSGIFDCVLLQGGRRRHLSAKI